MMLMECLILALLIALAITVHNLAFYTVYLQILGQTGKPIDVKKDVLEMIPQQHRLIHKIRMDAV